MRIRRRFGVFGVYGYRCRQGKAKNAAASWFGLYPNLAAVQCHKGFANRKTKTRALWLRPFRFGDLIKFLENFFRFIGWYSRTRIGYGQLNVAFSIS